MWRLNPFYSTRSAANLQEALAYEAVESSGWTGQFTDTNGLRVLTLAEADKIQMRYDAALRVIETENADHSVNRTIYEPLLSRQNHENDTNPGSTEAGTPIVQRQDGLGRLVQVDQVTRLNDDGTPSGSLQTWATRYAFDLNDQLTRIADAQDNVRTFVCDGSSARSASAILIAVLCTFAYDSASNLTNTLMQKASRLATPTTAPTGSGQNLPRRSALAPLADNRRALSTNYSVAYHYDVPNPNLPQGDGTTATARNVKGALAWVEDLSGEEHNSYDERGRTETVVKRIADPLSGSDRRRVGFLQDGIFLRRSGSSRQAHLSRFGSSAI